MSVYKVRILRYFYPLTGYLYLVNSLFPNCPPLVCKFYRTYTCLYGQELIRCKAYFYKLLIICILFFISSCKNDYIPKPRGYFRIDFPEKEYQLFSSDCNYRFEYPTYAKIAKFEGPNAQPCWINIEFPSFKSKIHITYKKINHNLSSYFEDVRTIAYKHIIKADDIIETPVINENKRVYGMIYDIKGNTASSVNFYLTDSIQNFFSASLYFSVVPNKDSLAPVISFFKKDIEHLIETFEWK